ncbi:MAG: T9SS type A sorting domain-containing protein [Aureispira sp.]
MKSFLLGCFLSLTSACLSAQNWAPIQGGYVYYYTDSIAIENITLGFDHVPIGFAGVGLDRITTLEVEQQIDSNGIRQFTVQPYISPCDSCTIPTLITMQKPAWNGLYPTICQQVNGQYQFIVHEDTLHWATNPLLTPANLNPNYLISIGSKTVNSVFSIFSTGLDSTVCIQINTSNNLPLYKFYLAKDYGVYKVEQFDSLSTLLIAQFFLVGRQETASFTADGLHSLKYREIFDFQVGDQFYYLFEDGNRGGWPASEVHYRLKILERHDQSADTLRYVAERYLYRMYDYYFLRGRFSSAIDTIDLVYTNNRQEQYNQYSHELKPSSKNYIHNYSTTPYLACNDFVFGATSGAKYIGYNMGFTINPATLPFYSMYPYYSNFINTAPDTYQIDTAVWYTFTGLSPHREAYLYVAGLGCTSYFYSISYSQTEQRLIGYIKGTDTVGIPPPIFLSSKKIAPLSNNNIPQLQIAPNPIQKQLQFHYQIQSPQGEITLSIINTLGQVLQQQTIIEQQEEHYTFALDHLIKGAYWLQVRRGQQVLTTKPFIKY